MSKTQKPKTSLEQEIRIPVLAEDKKTEVLLGAYILAQSACKNNIDLDSFVMTLNSFCDTVDLSKTPVGVVYAWREQAIEYYLNSTVTDDPVAAEDKAKQN